jgi:ABC-2 type transport system ATP-binding protein
VRDVIRRLRASGTTVFLNSHLLSEVEMVCDRVAIIDHGRVVRQGALADLVAGTIEAEVRLQDASTALLAGLQAQWPSVTPAQHDGAGRVTLRLGVRDEADLPAIADVVLRGGARLHALVPHQRTLEELFVQSVETREV